MCSRRQGSGFHAAELARTVRCRNLRRSSCSIWDRPSHCRHRSERCGRPSRPSSGRTIRGKNKNKINFPLRIWCKWSSTHLFVPRRIQTGRNVQTQTVEWQLQHLGSAFKATTIEVRWLWHIVQFSIFDNCGARQTIGDAAQKQLTSQSWLSLVADIVLTHIAMHPIIQIQPLVVQRNQNVSHHAAHFAFLARCIADAFRWNINHFFHFEMLFRLVRAIEAIHIRIQGASNVADCLLRVMQETHFERCYSLLAQIDRLNQSVIGPAIEIQMTSHLFRVVHILVAPSAFEQFRCWPFGGHHYIEMGLIPKIVATLSSLLATHPRAHAIERRIELNEITFGIVVCIAHRRYQNRTIGQTVRRMRRWHIVAEHHAAIDLLVYNWFAKILSNVKHIHPIRMQRGQNQFISLRQFVAGRAIFNCVTTWARIPSAVMQFVASLVRECAMNNRRIGRTVWIDVDGRQIVAMHLIQVRLNRHHVQQLFARTIFHCVQWARIAWTMFATSRSSWNRDKQRNR